MSLGLGLTALGQARGPNCLSAKALDGLALTRYLQPNVLGFDGLYGGCQLGFDLSRI